MPRKKAQQVKGGFDDAKHPASALDVAIWGKFAKSPFRDLAYVVWSSARGEMPDLPKTIAAKWKRSYKESERKLGELVAEAVKAGDHKALAQFAEMVDHFNSTANKDGSLPVVDKLRDLALSFYLGMGGKYARPPVTASRVRDYLEKMGRPCKQRIIHRIFKEELGIDLAKGKSGPRSVDNKR